MNDFIDLDENQPATLDAVLLAVARLSTLSEDQILEIASSGDLRNHFPFRPAKISDDVEDFVDEADLEEASPLPLSRQERANLIQSSMPARASRRGPTPEAISSIDRAYSENTLRASREVLVRDLGIDNHLADLLAQRGFSKPDQIANMSIVQLESIADLDQGVAQDLLLRARKASQANAKVDEHTRGMPESFTVLVKEIRSLATDVPNNKNKKQHSEN